MQIGGTLDADGDRIMQLTDDEDPMCLSDKADMRADDEEIQLSMSALIFSNSHLIYYI